MKKIKASKWGFFVKYSAKSVKILITLLHIMNINATFDASNND